MPIPIHLNSPSGRQPEPARIAAWTALARESGVGQMECPEYKFLGFGNDAISSDGRDERDTTIFKQLLRNSPDPARWSAEEQRNKAKLAPICQGSRMESR